MLNMGYQASSQITATNNSGDEIQTGWTFDPHASGYRLPTQIEWQLACRAGSATGYSFGDDPAELPDYGVSGGDADPQVQKVGTRRPNRWGLFDMHGNVREWCSDAPLAAAEVQRDDLVGQMDAATKASFGGCWLSPPKLCRSNTLYPLVVGERSPDTGFRIVRTVP